MPYNAKLIYIFIIDSITMPISYYEEVSISRFLLLPIPAL